MKTVDIIVNANVPPNGSATAIRDMTVAMLFGKNPTAWRDPEDVVRR